MYINFICHIQMSKYIYKKQDIYTFAYLKVILRFLPNLQRLNRITKSVKSINLKTN